ncbi:hypothetical protein AOX55_00006087 (plasmid) [Sinorhizobium fredii CCBAU 25509]|nr:hypothetical protein AOX55_00006087 [Sinorhizobium fredii CCBAU 25509]
MKWIFLQSPPREKKLGLEDRFHRQFAQPMESDAPTDHQGSREHLA